MGVACIACIIIVYFVPAYVKLIGNFHREQIDTCVRALTYIDTQKLQCVRHNRELTAYYYLYYTSHNVRLSMGK